MKVTTKITLLLMAGVLAIFAVETLLSVRRDRELMLDDSVHDDILLGRTIAAGTERVWRAVSARTSHGQERAIEHVEAVARYSAPTSVRWISLTPPPPELRSEPLAALLDGQQSATVEADRTLVYVPLGSVDHGAIEVSEPLAPQHQHLREMVWAALGTTLAVAALGALLAFVLGEWIVGRPVRKLVDQAKRIGGGELAPPPVELDADDEFRDLAAEINSMSARLAATQAAVAAEARSKLDTIEQLRHADRLMTVGKLAAGMAHELGTPLNVIGGHAGLLAEDDVDAHARRSSAGVIMEQTQRMTALIRQLLDFSRQRRPQKVATDLGELVERAVPVLVPMAQKYQIVIRTVCAGATVASLDAGQIQQVLTNLVVNAIQAMKKPGTIVVGVSRCALRPPHDARAPLADYVCLSVEDEGPGMPADVVAHIFEPFFTTKDIGEGTGLGLSVSHGLVREHGGWITVDSLPGEGTCFSIFLPVGGDATRTAE